MIGITAGKIVSKPMEEHTDKWVVHHTNNNPSLSRHVTSLLRSYIHQRVYHLPHYFIIVVWLFARPPRFRNSVGAQTGVQGVSLYLYSLFLYCVWADGSVEWGSGVWRS